MSDNTTQGSVGLKFAQFKKNRLFNASVKRSPYQALLDVEPRVSLNSTSSSTEMLD
jgi:hypothetical protein